jgi:uncharacterized short protein YbdD (DUF466 family)
MNLQRLTHWLSASWDLLRTLTTDDAYDRYLAHHARAHAGSPPMSRRAFYLKQQQNKWTGVSRCC